MRPKPNWTQLYATGPSVAVTQILGLFGCQFQAMRKFCKTSKNRSFSAYLQGEKYTIKYYVARSVRY